DPRIEKFDVGDDTVYDNRLILPDVLGSIAHAAGLEKIGLLTTETFWQLQAGLAKIAELAETGEFTIEPGDEDVHTKIENWLTQQLGEAGKKIHTGRSRNDQVLVDLRLFTREAVLPVYTAVLEACDALLDLATRHAQTPMPGYTHMQRAMLSSVGVWAGAYLEALLDDLDLLDAAVKLSDQNPLGSAASYGVALPLDRQYVSDLLGFGKVQSNVLYAQNARGKFEAAIVQALTQISLDFSKLAQDIMLFTTSEYNFFKVDDSLLTGSSIMPQKRNLGAVELLRAKGQVMLGYSQQMIGVLVGLPAGYNVDSQETKRPFMEALDLVENSAAVVALTVSRLVPNTEAMEDACTPELFATDVAYDLVMQGVPFRDAYKQVALSLDKLDDVDPHYHLSKRTHQGTSGDLRLDVSADKIDERKNALSARAEELQAIKTGLLAGTAPGLPFPKPDPTSGSLPQPTGDASDS
ncbi:MAG TPA: argininosuccinate lyase, partial [Thermomicrobiales bacterium]|nr:argininosuccinate lyase [Thermomicrobiales bacterium]